MSAASWNLCRRDEEARKAGFPDVCWWEEDRTFSKIKENHLETVNVPPDSLWFVSIKGDYMGRVIGNIFIAENNSLPWVGTVPEWKACKRNVISARRNVANTRRLPRGGGRPRGVAPAPALRVARRARGGRLRDAQGEGLVAQARREARGDGESPGPRGDPGHGQADAQEWRIIDAVGRALPDA